MTARPLLHFATAAEWINDPNGLVVHDGEYHLFFQHNPHGSQWGQMGWGHAVSADLVTWRQLPSSLTPYDHDASGAVTMIFSGSALIDPAGVAGAGAGAMIACFTAHRRRGEEPLGECQALAASIDGGATWTHLGVVLDRQRREFRDPKIFPHGDGFAMAVAVPDEHAVEFYGSGDLRHWELTGRFSRTGVTDRVWECPDLALVPIEGGGAAWVLCWSADHPSGPPYSGMHYLVGDFDGRTFTPFDETIRPVDYGKDFFAAVTYNGLPAGAPPVMVGWAGNWAYASALPALPWRGMMALPRRLALRRVEGTLHLVQRPVDVDHRLDPPQSLSNDAFAAAQIDIAGAEPFRLVLTARSAASFDLGEVAIERDATGVISVDRRRLAAADQPTPYPSIERAQVRPGAPDDVRVIVDHSVVEVFAGDGETVLTTLAIPAARWVLHAEYSGRGEIKFRLPRHEGGG